MAESLADLLEKEIDIRVLIGQASASILGIIERPPNQVLQTKDLFVWEASKRVYNKKKRL